MKLPRIAVLAFLTLLSVPAALAQQGTGAPGMERSQPQGMSPQMQGMMGMRGGSQMHGMMGQGGMMPMRVMMILMDANADGELSLEEVQAAHARIFKAVDADNSGGVTFEEMQAFMRGTAATGAR